MIKFLAEVEIGKSKILNLGLLLLTVASMYFTYGGVTLFAENFEDKAHGSVFAIGSGMAIYLFWWAALKTVPFQEDKRQIALGLISTLVGVFMIFWVSTMQNIRDLVGLDALEKHVSVSVGTTEDIIDFKYQRGQLIEGVAVDIRSEIERYKTAAENEFKYGTYSGVAGPGAVHSALLDIHGSFVTLGSEAETFIGRVNNTNISSQGRLVKLREIASSERSYNDRTRLMSRETNAMRAELARVNVDNFAASVLRTLEGLPSKLELVSTFSKDADVARRQRLALDKIRKDIELSNSKLRVFIDAVTANPGPEFEAFEKLSPEAAIIRYWINYAPFIAGGLSLDLAPFWALLFIIIAVARLTPEDLRRIKVLGLTVEDIVTAQLGKDAIDDRINAREDIRAVKDFNFGRKQDRVDLKKEDEGS